MSKLGHIFDFFLRRESADDHRAKDSENYADDLDMLISPKDGTLLPVAIVNGVHACWVCFDQFVEDPTHKHRMVEWRDPEGQGVRIGIHAGCVKQAGRYKGDIFFDKVQGHQARRAATKLSLPTGSNGP